MVWFDMKLIIAIVQNEDSYALSDALMEAEFYVTKLSTTGGFLKKNNVTLLIGTEEENVDSVLEIINNMCKNREQIISAPVQLGSVEDLFTSYPLKIKIGGATVFVIDVDRFEKF
jgi:uncharacterized protein YaaQ